MDEWMRLQENYRSPGATPPPSPPQQPARPAPDSRGYRPDPSERASERAARLTLTGLAAGFTVLVIGLVVFFTVRTLREKEAAQQPTLGTTKVTTPEDAARLLGGLGPPAGTEVGAYIESRTQALAAATGDRVAVVSLDDYATERNARAMVGSAEVLGLLAAAPGGQPAVVTGSVSDWVSSQTADARAERDEFQKLIPTVDDPSFKKFYQSEVDRLNVLISSVKPNGALIFGLVVRAPAAELQALAAKDGVRLVDVGPGPDPDPKNNYRGLRPEETEKTNEPNTRPT